MRNIYKHARTFALRHKNGLLALVVLFLYLLQGTLETVLV